MSLSIPTPKTVRQQGNEGKRLLPPVVPFLRIKKPDLKKDEFLTFKLRSNPGQDTSPTYDLSVPFFNRGTAEELFDLLKNINRVCTGQNITDGPGRYSLARRLLQGDALAAFNRHATQRGNETVANFKLVLQDLTTHVLPRRALQLQRRYMRRTVRKSPEMSTREFITRLMEVNQLLNEFPPFAANQALPEDKILDIAEFAIPASWQKTMVLQGFDPTTHTPNKFIEFCERLEFAKGFNAQQHNNKKEMSSQADPSGCSTETLTRSANKSSRRGKNHNKKRKERDLYCELHGTTDHDTGECKVLKAQAHKMRANWETHRSNYGPRKNHND